jgi:hypothetical protein
VTGKYRLGGTLAKRIHHLHPVLMSCSEKAARGKGVMPRRTGFGKGSIGYIYVLLFHL